MPLHRNRPDRTGGKTCAATSATLEFQLGAGNTTESWPKPDRRRFATLAADPALHPAQRDAGFADGRAQRPGRRAIIADQRRRLARGDAFATEGAFADRKIDPGVSAVAKLHHARRTDGNTVVTTSAEGF
ncbi:hypothetical protein RZS08_21925, partial [Arthrospira platensis SPKY1]|nr:hypothetical protein [Arthrospira platensis SPKY1]